MPQGQPDVQQDQPDMPDQPDVQHHQPDVQHQQPDMQQDQPDVQPEEDDDLPCGVAQPGDEDLPDYHAMFLRDHPNTSLSHHRLDDLLSEYYWYRSARRYWSP
eukprot:4950795-Alexandrium_andersonii.AAC.1